ncbi:MAG TPA: leucine-rich repeat domain-containing protein [Spirochaetota bacterium]|jgi:Leucine-rich repeat (LRR) protein|nr:MAG: Internalin-A precursor [Spirochaetes bacterium ADurb.Bin133]HNZ26323.1 leucine-rich repeat domain-containing protein [Spirochaetota bacterium]HPY88405.1 leucine-rich repeat domain-containing protein [Spirochaetota bacterium]HQB61336.1 leucine-rich repeat domain-containing protein [Spirochaetota bacterium]
MSILEVYNKLLDLYAEDNLNKISAALINAFKRKNSAYIKKVYSKFSKISPEDSVNKMFARLIVIFNPDRLDANKKDLELSYKSGKMKELKGLIEIIESINNGEITVKEKPAAAKNADTTIPKKSGGNITGLGESINENTYAFDKPGYDFFSAVKLREYGNIKVNLKHHRLKDLEGEQNFSDSEIEDLNGLEYCINITSINLSYNRIKDISAFAGLESLTEIDLSNNFIDKIDSLETLKNLKYLDLSFNKIDDISALFNLPNLKYLNVVGNKVPIEQIYRTIREGVLAVY